MFINHLKSILTVYAYLFEIDKILTFYRYFKIFIKSLPSMTEVSQQVLKAKPQTLQSRKGVNQSAERVFKYSAYFCIMTIIICVPGFLNFRSYLQSKGYYVFSTEGIYMILIGFISIFITRYSYYKFARPYMGQFVKSKYQGEQRERKIDVFLKLTFDWAFYLSVTIYFFLEFKNEYWFPQALGGEGSCDNIYKEYPDWPATKRSSIQDYFCYQLGVHIFTLFQLFVIRGRKQRKYYEWMLHHTLASTLILFSMMCNQTVMGAMILAIHDASDIFLASSRFYFEAQLPKWFKNPFMQICMIVQAFASWIYLRLTIFPFCLLGNVYKKIPTASDEWYMIKWEYIYLLFLASILVAMHIYWLFYMIKSMIAYIRKQDVINVYDVHKSQ